VKKKMMVFFKNKDDNFYKIIKNIRISIIQNVITIKVSVKIWDSGNLKWFSTFFSIFLNSSEMAKFIWSKV